MIGHNYSIAASLLPQESPGSRIRVRHLDGKIGRQYFTAGGFFSESSSKMRQADLVKACALTIDVDAYDWSGASQWGEDRDARKKAMRAASEAEVLAWFDASGFVEVVREEAVRVGLPSRPNRILYTGQGINLVYWIEDAIGWTSGEGWTADRMKATIKRFHAARPDLWFWDSSGERLSVRGSSRFRRFRIGTPGRSSASSNRHDQVRAASRAGSRIARSGDYPAPEAGKEGARDSANKYEEEDGRLHNRRRRAHGQRRYTIERPFIPTFDVGGRGTVSSVRRKRLPTARRRALFLLLMSDTLPRRTGRSSIRPTKSPVRRDRDSRSRPTAALYGRGKSRRIL